MNKPAEQVRPEAGESPINPPIPAIRWPPALDFLGSAERTFHTGQVHNPCEPITTVTTIVVADIKRGKQVGIGQERQRQVGQVQERTRGTDRAGRTTGRPERQVKWRRADERKQKAGDDRETPRAPAGAGGRVEG